MLLGFSVDISLIIFGVVIVVSGVARSWFPPRDIQLEAGHCLLGLSMVAFAATNIYVLYVVGRQRQNVPGPYKATGSELSNYWIAVPIGVASAMLVVAVIMWWMRHFTVALPYLAAAAMVYNIGLSAAAIDYLSLNWLKVGWAVAAVTFVGYSVPSIVAGVKGRRYRRR